MGMKTPSSPNNVERFYFVVDLIFDTHNLLYAEQLHTQGFPPHTWLLRI